MCRLYSFALGPNSCLFIVPPLAYNVWCGYISFDLSAVFYLNLHTHTSFFLDFGYEMVAWLLSSYFHWKYRSFLFKTWSICVLLLCYDCGQGPVFISSFLFPWDFCVSVMNEADYLSRRSFRTEAQVHSFSLSPSLSFTHCVSVPFEQNSCQAFPSHTLHQFLLVRVKFCLNKQAYRPGS